MEEVIFLQEQRQHPHGDGGDHDPGGPAWRFRRSSPTGRPEHLELLGPSTLRGDTVWCQPVLRAQAAGSDLAGHRHVGRARTADRWIVNGQKVWTVGGVFRRLGLCYSSARIGSVPKHRGLTYFLLDMRSPGVEVRPLRQLGGRSEFNEVFSDRREHSRSHARRSRRSGGGRWPSRPCRTSGSH